MLIREKLFGIFNDSCSISYLFLEIDWWRLPINVETTVWHKWCYENNVCFMYFLLFIRIFWLKTTYKIAFFITRAYGFDLHFSSLLSFYWMAEILRKIQICSIIIIYRFLYAIDFDGILISMKGENAISIWYEKKVLSLSFCGNQIANMYIQYHFNYFL